MALLILATTAGEVTPAQLTALVIGLGFLAFCLVLYFLPALIAHGRGKANTVAIFWLNLLAGWTFIGWVVALVWALTVDAPVAAREVR